jgi:hypothetical protein
MKPVDTQCCIYCNPRLRYNKYDPIQKLNPRGRGRYFTINLGLEKMHATQQMTNRYRLSYSILEFALAKWAISRIFC